MPGLEKSWIDITAKRFDHPAIVLWRAIEARKIHEMMNRYPLTEPVLDLGCAEGNIGEMLFEDRMLIGLDNCWELLSRNKATHIYDGLILADGCRMPCRDSAFSGIFSNCVIEHIPDLDGLLSEAARVLKPGGLFVFTVPSDHFGEYLFFYELFRRIGLKGLANKYKEKRNAMLHHYHCYSAGDWEERLKSRGLRVKDFSYYMPKKTVMFWDALAAVCFICHKIPVLRFLPKRILKMLRGAFDKYYNLESQQEGGALLIVATKNG